MNIDLNDLMRCNSCGVIYDKNYVEKREKRPGCPCCAEDIYTCPVCKHETEVLVNENYY